MLSVALLGSVAALENSLTPDTPLDASHQDHGFSLGYAKGFTLGFKHSNQLDGEGDVTSFLEMAESLAPLFDEYDEPEHKAHHRHHHHAHGANPAPEDIDIEDAFLANYANTRPASVYATRPMAPNGRIASHAPKTISNVQVSELATDEAAASSREVTATNSTAPSIDAQRIEDQERRIRDLETKYEAAHNKLDMYEKQRNSMTAGSGVTDGSGKTEFIKGYEGGFKVGYEAGWNMATADLKKRYGFPENTGHVERNSTNTTAAAPAEVSNFARPAVPAPAPAASLNAIQADAPSTQAMNVDMFRNSMMRGNNPFFAQDVQQPQQPQQPQLMQQYADVQQPQQPDFSQFQQAPQQQFQQVPQQQFQPQQQMDFQPQQQNFMAPQGFDMSQFQQAQQQPQQFFNQAPPAEAERPLGLPQKAMQFLSNIKGMIQEGKDTFTAVQNVFQGDQHQQQMQQPAYAPSFPQMNFAQNMPQQGFNNAPQQGFAAPQGFNGFNGVQNLVQTDSTQQNPANLLSGLAGLLSGANANAADAKPQDQAFGLQNLAQLLATATGNQAMPKPVVAQPGLDSAALGMQEMQNMIQEGQRPVSV